jgi:lysophospholipase L1-like esterase
MRQAIAAAVALALGAGGGVSRAEPPTAAGPPPQQVGVLAAPCAALEPVPSVVAAFMVRYAKAKAEHQPPPVPTPEGLEIYNRWQERRLLQDFAGLCRYQGANAALPPATDRRVVFFGDSITELWGSTDPSLFSGDVIDRGVSGQTTAQMVGRFRADVVDLHPGVVHIIAGTNDIAGNTGPTSLDRIEANIQTVVELARAHHIRVVLGSVPPAARFDWRPSIMPIDSIRALNAWLQAYARREGLVYVDYYSALDDGRHGFKAALSEDGVHPNPAGYAVMRRLAEPALAEAERRPAP